MTSISSSRVRRVETRQNLDVVSHASFTRRMKERFSFFYFLLRAPNGGESCLWITGKFSFFFPPLFLPAFRENFSMAGTVLSDGNVLPHETITGGIMNGLAGKVLLTGCRRIERSHGDGLYLYDTRPLWIHSSKAIGS